MLDLWEHFWAGCGSGLQDDDSPIQAGGRLPPGVGRAPPGVHAGGCRTLAKNPISLRKPDSKPGLPGNSKLRTFQFRSVQPILLEMSLGPLPADHTGRSRESVLPFLASPAPSSLLPSLCSILPSCRSGLRPGVQSQALTVTPLPRWTM